MKLMPVSRINETYMPENHHKTTQNQAKMKRAKVRIHK